MIFFYFFRTFAREMKRLTLFYIFLCCFLLSASSQPKYEVRAVWLTTIGGIDWPSNYAHDGMGIEQQKQQLCDILDRLQALIRASSLPSFATDVTLRISIPQVLSLGTVVCLANQVCRQATMPYSLLSTNVIVEVWSFMLGW